VTMRQWTFPIFHALTAVVNPALDQVSLTPRRSAAFKRESTGDLELDPVPAVHATYAC